MSIKLTIARSSHYTGCPSCTSSADYWAGREGTHLRHCDIQYCTILQTIERSIVTYAILNDHKSCTRCDLPRCMSEKRPSLAGVPISKHKIYCCLLEPTTLPIGNVSQIQRDKRQKESPKDNKQIRQWRMLLQQRPVIV